MKGRITIAGRMLGDGYGLRSSLDEVGPAVLPGHLRERRILQGEMSVGVGVGAGVSPGYIPPLNIPVEMWTWKNNLQQLRFLGTQGPAIDQAVPEEYRQYAKIFFLNEGALRMFKESAIRLNVLREIPAEQLPVGCKRNLRGAYFPF